jgi:hypothetical protein
MIRLARAADVAAVTAIVKDAYSIYLARDGKMPGPMRGDCPAVIPETRHHAAR